MSDWASTILDDSTSSAHLFQKIVVLGNRAHCENVKQDNFECAVDGFVWGPRPSVQRSLALLCAALTIRIF